MLAPQTLAALLATAALTTTAQTFVTPKLGGGQIAAEMVHINIFYDDQLNQLQAVVDDYATPELRALEPGYSFDPAEAFVVLNGKAYNAQYGWNAGGFFTIPPGAAIWVEALDSSPNLEVYEGSGRFASYAPIFGTAGSPRRWKWSGVMVHNTYAIRSPAAGAWFANYHVYFGDALTGERAPFAHLGSANVHLQWNTLPLPLPLPLEFGAAALTNGAPASLLNAPTLTPASRYVLNLDRADPDATLFEAPLPLTALAASPAHGGPITGHALPGAQLQLQVRALRGPPGAQLLFLEPGPGSFSLAVGDDRATNLLAITQSAPGPDADPYGNLQGRRIAATSPGLYELTFRVLDASTNGPSAGPRHAPSENYHLYLQAGLTIASLTLSNHTASVVFAGQCGKLFTLENSTALAPATSWTPTGPTVPGTNYLQTLSCTLTNPAQAFFRLRAQ